jgi:ribose transport system substrate-binding protein
MSKIRRLRLGGLAAFAVATALVAAACSGSSGGEAMQASATDIEKGLAAAKQVLTQAEAGVTQVNAPATSPKPAPGKLVVSIPCSYAAEGCKRGVDAVAEAAATLGWRNQMIDPGGDPEKMRQAVRTAIQLHAAGIFLAATPPAVVKDDVAAARAAGIKVVNMFEPSPDGFADANSLQDHPQAGRWDAAQLTVATEGKGKIILVNDPEFASVQEWHQGVVDGLKEFCPGCQVVKDINFQIATLQTQVPTEFQAALQANPGVNAVWTSYDPVAAAITPIIERSANGDKIKVVSHNGDPFALNFIKAGDKPLVGTVAYPIEWQSYQAVDQLNRLFAGDLPADRVTLNVPNKLIVKDNVTTVPWNGDVDWKSAYTSLWTTAK